MFWVGNPAKISRVALFSNRLTYGLGRCAYDFGRLTYDFKTAQKTV